MTTRSNIRIIVPQADGTTKTVHHDPVEYRRGSKRGGLGRTGRNTLVNDIMSFLGRPVT